MERPKEEAQRYYDRLNKIYDWLTASERSSIEKSVTAFAPASGETLLEIGCGTGMGRASIAASLGDTGRSIGLDPIHKMLLPAQQKTLSSSRPGALLIQGDATEIPLGNDAVDSVSCAYALELFSRGEMVALLKEIQ